MWEKIWDLVLKYIVAMLACIQCCYAEVIINTKKEFEHYVYEMSWRANASEYVNNPEVKGWFKGDKYKESIFKTIAKAIADCVQRKGEFEDIKGQVVEFKGTNPESYTCSNWNAVILWNYLAHVIDDRYEKVTLNNEGITQIGDIIKQYYNHQYDAKIGYAIKNIQAYANELNMYHELIS